MRRPILPSSGAPAAAAVLGLLAGCGGQSDEGYVVVADFARSAAAVGCEAVSLGRDIAVTELRSISDTTWLVLDEAGRQVLVFDDRLRLVRELRYPAAGPGSLDAPVSVTLLGDTALVAAERAGLRLVALALDGEELRSTPLDFVPRALAATPDGAVMVTPMPLGEHPPSLLGRYDGAGIEWLSIPVRRYPDMMVTALGNSVLVESLPGGDVLLVHQFLAPRAFRVGSGGSAIEPLRVPIPDGTAGQVDFVPTAPITGPQLPRMLTPAMAMSVDPVRSEVYLLTRSGRTIGGRPERAILRLTDRLALIEAFTIPVIAGGMVYLPHRGTALVVDDEDRFHACRLHPTPPLAGHSPPEPDGPPGSDPGG